MPLPHMTPEAHSAYLRALKRIEACRGKGKEAPFLNLSGLGLSQVPPEIGQLSALTGLDLHANQLTSLPPEIGQLSALTGLDLHANQLTSLPPEIGQLSALKELRLSHNQLTSLPPEIGQLSDLTLLHLHNNKLTCIPPEIGQLSLLEGLRLDQNQLTSLPSEIGQLSALVWFDLDNNQLTSLPPEIGRIGSLGMLRARNNPLPQELLKLAKGGSSQFISYLRGLQEGSVASGSAVPKCFNEAKLLLVGPGNVGKTWLLKALQGEVPDVKESTKGMEIAREPVILPHPAEKQRQLKLNAWDFGGQDHYQVTHQIFFSAKAIYLLVWKPRTGIDPDLIARLERIQLSAGQTAKVLIVSTHADGAVPAVIGQEALRERFGDMIWGFYETDSALGAEGTGIAALKQEIARAAAQLEAMDLPFPAHWHEAQAVIRALKKPTVSFKDFAKACARHGLNEVSAAALAGIMEVQGHAVYFADAATDAAACLSAEENLVVLDPEWLAKAVGFVLEDKTTMAHSGSLKHSRLAQIWKKDAQRHCPGYEAALHGYLLWLMWRFDIAYKQTEQMSLVPELIQRNRLDDLRWTPALPAREPEATLICRIPQDPPVGMIPALTAAVHPLRRLEDREVSSALKDTLDQNWRDGFFLDSALRGTAFVELLDRDLRIVVRDKYPSDLSNRIERTLGEIVKQRWPRLVMDVRVPCIGKVSGKLCKGTFRKSRLEERRGQMVYCEECGLDLDAAKMLEGFDAHEEAVMTQLRALKLDQSALLDGQRELMAASYRFFQQALDPARRELERAPCLLTILPEKAKDWQMLSKLAVHKLRVTCWCEHPDGPHPGAVIGSGDAPDYVLTMPKDWLVKAAPYINWAGMLLKAFVPMAGSIVSQGLGENASAELKLNISLMNDAAKALPTGKLELDTRAEMEPMHHARPEIVALRHIHDALLAQVKDGKRWGDLRPVSTKSGELLWLCAKHAAIQQPPVQQL